MAVKTSKDVGGVVRYPVDDAVRKSRHKRTAPVAPKFGVRKRILFDAEEGVLDGPLKSVA